MEITKDTVEMILIMLYKLDEFEACEKLLEVYKRHFTDSQIYH